MENIILDVADLNTGVLCCWSVLEQWLEPGSNRRTHGYIIAEDGGGGYINKQLHSSPGWSCKQQNFMCIKRFPLHQESDVRHVLVVKEVGVWKKKKDDDDYNMN